MYITVNEIPRIPDINKWVSVSPLRADWYSFVAELIGNPEANVIQATHGRGGNKECLQKLLNKWWNSTEAANRNWQTIVDALNNIPDAIPVVEDITDKCKIP